MKPLNELITLADRMMWAREQKSERDQVEFTQEDLAKKAGVSQGSIGHLESGRTKTPRALTRIADALGVRVVWLAENKGHPFEGAKPGVAPAADRPPAVVAVEKGELSLDGPAPPVSLQWLGSDEHALLIDYRATDARGKKKILRTAQSVPKALVTGIVSNQS